MLKLIAFMVITYFFFKLLNRVILGIIGGGQRENFSQYGRPSGEKDISDRGRIIEKSE